jgi:hypothetical protein
VTNDPVKEAVASSSEGGNFKTVAKYRTSEVT